MLRRKKEHHKPPLPALGAASDKKTEFFMAASHQLKSPVAIVQWCLQSLAEDKTLSPANRSMVNRALDQANGMSRLLGDMLHVFRIMRQDSSTLSPVDVNCLINEIMAQYQPVAHEHNVRLLAGAIEKLPPIMADETYFRQAIINLIDNAIKYTPEHGRVEIRASAHRGYIVLEVEDSGIGIADADHHRLFTEFFRAENAKDKTGNGTGLGLVLVKHIVESVGGEISFKSRIGKGTVFTVKVPTHQ